MTLAPPSKDRQDRIFETLRASAAEVLSRHGITVQRKPESAWLNMSLCPLCNHKGFQCGIHETAVTGGYWHAVKCNHSHDSPLGDDTPHYADFLAVLGELSTDEAAWVKTMKARAPAMADGGRAPVPMSPAPGPVAIALDPLAPMNVENNDRARRRLRDNVAALNYLHKKRGLTDSTLERFKLGLAQAFEKDGVLVTANALAAPLVGVDGRFYKKYVNYAIPGVTIDNRDHPSKAWSAGPARTYYNGNVTGKKWLFVCDGLKDLWSLAQLIAGTDLDRDLALISSTNGGGGFPAEWRTELFWQRWEKIYAGHDNDKPDSMTGKRAGDEHAKAISLAAVRDVMRVTPPGVKDWNDWVLASPNHDVESFRKLLQLAEPVKVVEQVQGSDDLVTEGSFSANPVSIVGAYHRGFLYEAVRILVRGRDKDGNVTEHYDTLVIRSDRTRHEVERKRPPPGVHERDVVYRLKPDGTLLSRSPTPNPMLTWSWPSIQAWLEKRDRTPPLVTLIERVAAHLKACVWLPHADDYTLLACTVVASYVQQIFEAVPLILVTGAAGTGKSELGMAMLAVGANCGPMLGVVTAATIARHIDNTRGLIVIDDIEDIANSKEVMFTDLVQTLKLSYKKSTARKMVTEFRNGHSFQREFNFFGIKVLGNTRGADSILGSRMLVIETRRMPTGLRLDSQGMLAGEAAGEVRDHLHTWAFNNVKTVADAYHAIFPHKSSRAEEIAAPLKVVATLSGSKAILDSLERALNRQTKVRTNPDNPEEVMREALESILRRSIEVRGEVPTWVSVAEVMMEMAVLVDDNYGKDFTTSLASIQKPEWVGRTMRQLYSDPSVDQVRGKLFGKGMRAYKLSDDFVHRVIADVEKSAPELTKQPLRSTTDYRAFCAGCPACPYRNRCDMQKEREGKVVAIQPSRRVV